MANSDMLVRIKANTDNYNAGIAKAKRTLEGFKQENLTIGGVLNQATKSLTAYAAGVASLTAVAGALHGLVDESVQLAKQGEGIRLAFERLNRPDLLDGLRQATHNTVTDIELMKQAVKFDNFKLSLDDMGTMLAFAQQKAKDTGESIDYMVNSITTGLGRQSKQILDNLGISAAELTKRMNEGKTMTEAVADIIREEMGKAGDYINTASDKAAQADVKIKNAMEQLGQTFAPLASAGSEMWNSLKLGGIQLLNDALDPIISAMRTLGMLEEEIVNNTPTYKPQDWSSQNTGTLGTYVETTDENGKVIKSQHYDGEIDKKQRNKYNRELEKMLTGSGSKTKKSLPEYRDFSKLLFDNSSEDFKRETPHTAVFEMFQSTAKFDPENILGSADNWEKYKDTITGTVGSVKESFSNLTEWTADFDPFKESMDNLNKTAMQSKMAFGVAANSVSTLGSALAGMEDPGVRAAGIVLQSIASIAMGFAQAAASPLVTGTGWGWLAFVAAGVAAMATTISTIHQLTGYAEGGIVGGNSYSGDNIYGGGAMVNSGELVLNKAQQGNLASQLQGNGLQNMNIAGRIKGTDIILSVDRTLQLQGKQMLTWG